MVTFNESLITEESAQHIIPITLLINNINTTYIYIYIYQFKNSLFATFVKVTEVILNCAWDLALARCTCCIFWNCCNLEAKLIPLHIFSTFCVTRPSWVECDPLSAWFRPLEFEVSGDVFLCSSPVKEYEGTVFNRVRNILNAALCCIKRLLNMNKRNEEIPNKTR